MLMVAATSRAQTSPSIGEQIAKTYGIDSWDKVEAIRYTWNGEITGLFKAAHKWEWEPKTGKISYEGTDKAGKPVKVTYDGSHLGSQSDQVKNEVERPFVNDNYWLLFVFHAYWDKSAMVTDEGMKKLPMGAGSAELVSVKYPPEAGGYTPGDTWGLYVGKDNRVEYLVFRHGGTEKPSLGSVGTNGGLLEQGSKTNVGGTVYVPVIRDRSLSRIQAMRMTEQVIKAIESSTPYKVVGKLEEADLIWDTRLVPRVRPGQTPR